MKKISKSEMKKEFRLLEESNLMGVKGVLKIDSGKLGPVFGITVCTHGNELAGLAAVYYLRKIYNIKNKLLSGSIIIAVNNLEACKKALIAKSEFERLNSRYCDVNMNRLPRNLNKIHDDNRYEINRAKSLLSVWKMFDVAIDIHSTIQNNPPMVIARNNLDYRLIKNFPIDILITNIDKVQSGIPPAFGFYGNKKSTQTVGIEAGQHDSPSSQMVAVECIITMMDAVGMIKKSQLVSKKKIFREYKVFGSVVFKDRKSRLSRVFKDFEPIKRGKLLAIKNDVKVYAQTDCCILMAPKGIRPVKINEEAIFLSQPMIKRIIK